MYITRSLKFCLITVTVLLILECALRLVTGPPDSFFNFLTPAPEGALYPQNVTLRYTWGPVDYSVRTNSHGLRGEDFPFKKRAGDFRVVTIGDSVTDGFFVDNEDTYQYALGRKLNQGDNQHIEVLNVARGGGTIDKELAILRVVAARLNPDVVVLLFVTNDIAELRGKTAKDFEHTNTGFNARPVAVELSYQLLSHTRLFNLLGYHIWRLFVAPNSMKMRERIASTTPYSFAGAANYDQNSEIFRKRFEGSDGLVLGDQLSPSAHQLLDLYSAGFEQFNRIVQGMNAKLLFAYCPSYTQIYESSPHREIQRLLGQLAAKHGALFADLTDFFRVSLNRAEPIHLAPADFHFNQRGNEMLANAIASAGHSFGLWPPSARQETGDMP
jgi:hypothetical protein